MVFRVFPLFFWFASCRRLIPPAPATVELLDLPQFTAIRPVLRWISLDSAALTPGGAALPRRPNLALATNPPNLIQSLD